MGTQLVNWMELNIYLMIKGVRGGAVGHDFNLRAWKEPAQGSVTLRKEEASAWSGSVRRGEGQLRFSVRLAVHSVCASA